MIIIIMQNQPVPALGRLPRLGLVQQQLRRRRTRISMHGYWLSRAEGRPPAVLLMQLWQRARWGQPQKQPPLQPPISMIIRMILEQARARAKSAAQRNAAPVAIAEAQANAEAVESAAIPPAAINIDNNFTNNDAHEGSSDADINAWILVAPRQQGSHQ